MKTNSLSFLLCIALSVMVLSACRKDELAENKRNVQKLRRLDQYLIDGVDKTAALLVADYTERYADDRRYTRTYTDKNGVKRNQDGAYEFSSPARLRISGVGSIEFSNVGTASFAHYDILKLTDTELWYTYTNGNQRHEFRLLKK